MTLPPIRRLRPSFWTVVALSGLTAFAGAAIAQTRAQTLTYDGCVSLVETSPQDALQKSALWAQADGGTAALHCEALALSALGRDADAAAALETLARDPRIAQDFRAALHAQASAAWLLAEEPDKAARAAEAALSRAPLNAGYRLDRAAAAIAAGDAARAQREADAAVELAPDTLEVWLFRARLRLAAEDLEGAAGDVARALTLAPDDVEVLRLRGRLRAAGADLD